MSKSELLVLAAKTFVDHARKEGKVYIFDDGTVFLGNAAGLSTANNYAKDRKVKYQTIAKTDVTKQIAEYEAQKKADAEKIENEKKARFMAKQALIDEKKDDVIIRQQALEAALLKQQEEKK
jgi:hypothetical protein